MSDIHGALHLQLARLKAVYEAERQAVAEIEQRKREAAAYTRELEERAAKRRRDQLELWQQNERYHENWRRTDGLFDRYRAAPPEQREIIEAALDKLFPRIMGDEYERRPHPPYHKMSADAKWVTLGAFLGIDATRDQYPVLVMDPEHWANDAYVFRHRAGKADLQPWLDNLPTIRDHIDAHQTEKAYFTAESWGDGVHVVITRRRPLPSSLGLDATMLVPEHQFFGIDIISQEPVLVPLKKVEHMLIGGATGFGKSNAMHLFTRNAIANRHVCEQIILCDGKTGITFNPYRNLDPKIRVITSVTDFRDMLAKLVVLIDQRNTELAESGKYSASTFIPLYIDEIATFTRATGRDKEAKELDKQLLSDLIYVCEKGRSAGVRIIVTSQTINEETVPVRVRGNCTSKIGFRMEIGGQVTEVFGSTKGLPVAPATLPKGQAIIRIDGWEGVTQFPYIPEGPVTLPIVAPAPPTLALDSPPDSEPPSTDSAMPVCKLHYETLMRQTNRDASDDKYPA